MKILLCAATEMEIAPTAAWLTAQQTGTVEVLITGIGLMASTHSLTKAVIAERPDLLIQGGIAGGFDEKESLGKVVAIRSETVADSGVKEEGRFRSLFDLRLSGANAFPYRNGRLINANDILCDCGLPLMDAITVNEISTDVERIASYKKDLEAQAESMEGAALHYVGLMEALPFLQLRSLSNFVGERDKTKWRMKEAVAALNNELQRVLKNLTA